MLKQSVRLLGLILAAWLLSSPQLLLAAAPTILPNSFYNNSTAQPTRLESRLSRRQGLHPIFAYPDLPGSCVNVEAPPMLTS